MKELLSKIIDKPLLKQALPENKNQHKKSFQYNLSKNNGDGLFAHQFYGSRSENQNKFASQFLTREWGETKSILSNETKISLFKNEERTNKKKEKNKIKTGKNTEYFEFSRISKAKKTEDQKPVLKFDQPLFLKGKEREYKLFHEELSHKRVTNSFLLKESTTTPFYPCWNEYLGRVVISNKLLSQKFANRLLSLSKIKGVERVVVFKEKKGNKKKREPTYFRGKRIAEEENKRKENWLKNQSALLKDFKKNKKTLIKENLFFTQEERRENKVINKTKEILKAIYKNKEDLYWKALAIVYLVAASKNALSLLSLIGTDNTEIIGQIGSKEKSKKEEKEQREREIEEQRQREEEEQRQREEEEQRQREEEKQREEERKKQEIVITCNKYYLKRKREADKEIKDLTNGITICRSAKTLPFSFRADASGNRRMVPMTDEIKAEIEENIQDSLDQIAEIREDLAIAGSDVGKSTDCFPMETISRWEIETIEIDDDNKRQPLRLKVVKREKNEE